MKPKKTGLYILIAYVAMQLLTLPALYPIREIVKMLNKDATVQEIKILTYGWTTFTMFLLGFIVILLLINRDRKFIAYPVKGKKVSIPASIGWGVLGFVFVLVAQVVAGLIEQVLFNVKGGSENTAVLSKIAAVSPIIIIAIAFIGPILEEIVFRRVIFGTLIQRFNFIIAALISALVFAVVHNEFSHLLIYASTGLVLAFLYYKTRRLLTTMIAHVMLNSFVMIIQLNADKIKSLSETYGQFIHFFH